MEQPIKITNIPTREEADLIARLLKLEKPTWKVKVIEQPGGRFTVLASPTETEDGGTPDRRGADGVSHASATVAHVKPLLDLIAKAESNGKYNAHFGNADNNNPKFTTMSVDEVIAWQKAFLNAGSISSAVGRYQILRGTLKDLKKKLKLTGAETFDAELQDRMGLALLKRRGLEEYLVGTKTVEAFIDDIAKEWAGLPNMTGKSHYDGDGINSAQITLGELRPVVESLR